MSARRGVSSAYLGEGAHDVLVVVEDLASRLSKTHREALERHDVPGSWYPLSLRAAPYGKANP